MRKKANGRNGREKDTIGRTDIFDDSKFRKRFPEFHVTTYRKGIEQIRDEREGIFTSK